MGEPTGWTHCHDCQDPMECGSWECCLYTSTQNRQASAMTRTKFSAQSAQALRTPEANKGRVARKVTHVVFCEADDGSWFELDAEDHGHAIVMAHNQVDLMNCRGASCWVVKPDGSLHDRAFYMYFPDDGML